MPRKAGPAWAGSGKFVPQKSFKLPGSVTRSPSQSSASSLGSRSMSYGASFDESSDNLGSKNTVHSSSVDICNTVSEQSQPLAEPQGGQPARKRQRVSDQALGAAFSVTKVMRGGITSVTTAVDRLRGSTVSNVKQPLKDAYVATTDVAKKASKQMWEELGKAEKSVQEGIDAGAKLQKDLADQAKSAVRAVKASVDVVNSSVTESIASAGSLVGVDLAPQAPLVLDADLLPSQGHTQSARAGSSDILIPQLMPPAGEGSGRARLAFLMEEDSEEAQWEVGRLAGASPLHTPKGGGMGLIANWLGGLDAQPSSSQSDRRQLVSAACGWLPYGNESEASRKRRQEEEAVSLFVQWLPDEEPAPDSSCGGDVGSGERASSWLPTLRDQKTVPRIGTLEGASEVDKREVPGQSHDSQKVSQLASPRRSTGRRVSWSDLATGQPISQISTPNPTRDATPIDALESPECEGTSMAELAAGNEDEEKPEILTEEERIQREEEETERTRKEEEERRMEEEERRKMERDALRKHLVAQHKAKKKERELQARIEAGLCRVDGSPLVDEEAVQRAAAQAREEEAAFQQKYQEEQRQRKEKTALVKKLRKSMQLHFHNTKTLPIDLWRAFKKFDVDDSGFIDFKEFQRVLSEVGLGNNVLTPAETLVMFQQCDDNSSGRVDFAEFLKTVVGNLTGL